MGFRRFRSWVLGFIGFGRVYINPSPVDKGSAANSTLNLPLVSREWKNGIDSS